MTDPLGQAQVIPYMRGLVAKGHQITILSFEKQEAYDRIHKQIENYLNTYGIAWVPLRYHANPPVVSTLFDLWRMWKQAIQLHRNSEFNIVHCRSYLAALIGLKIKRRYGVKFIFDMRGFWADERAEGKLWNLKKPLYRTIYNFFKRKELEFLNIADYTVSLTEQAKLEIASWKEVNDHARVKVIPCCVDTDHFIPSDDKIEDLRTELGLTSDNFVLTYLGSIGTWYMLDEMLTFFKVLKSHYPGAKFLFLSNEMPTVIMEKASSHGIDLIDIIVRSAPRKDVPRYLQISNLSIFFILPSYSKKASSPTKLGELLSLGIPVICNSGIGDVDSIINKGNCGILIEEFTDEAYEEAILEYKSTHFENLRQAAIDKFSLVKGVEAYEEVYQSL
jgi:glycosyltransferase involved in cell wall biosynthesis